MRYSIPSFYWSLLYRPGLSGLTTARVITVLSSNLSGNIIITQGWITPFPMWVSQPSDICSLRQTKLFIFSIEHWTLVGRESLRSLTQMTQLSCIRAPFKLNCWWALVTLLRIYNEWKQIRDMTSFQKKGTDNDGIKQIRTNKSLMI